jgi:hypothetical protein
MMKNICLDVRATPLLFSYNINSIKTTGYPPSLIYIILEKLEAAPYD